MIRFKNLKRIPFFIPVLFVACFTVRDMSTVNLVSTYREAEHSFHPEFVAFNTSDSTVLIYCRIKPSEFLYERQQDDNFRCFVKIRAELIESYELSKATDSSSASFSFTLAEKQEPRIIRLTLPTTNKSKSLLHVFITDQNKGVEEAYFINLDRLSRPSRQDFIFLNSKSEPYFRNYFYASDSVHIIFRDSTITKVTCKYYHRDFELAAPPFSFDVRSEFNYAPDSVFKINLSKGSFVFEREGLYHLQTDTSLREGCTFFRFNNSFPEITNPRQMIDATRYLLSKKEFDEMKNSAAPKTAMDNFWLSHGSNEERSRGLIKKYYGRVRDANRLFTSYTEGWRTDRGMIYVIFGMPTAVYKSPESESWTYGTPNSSLALNFFFIKVKNPFTENDFMLSRSPSYESNWYRAVETWRQGRAYNSFY